MKKHYLNWLLISLLALVVGVVYATETSVVAVGGGGSGQTPGDVITVTHTGSTPSAATIKVGTTINGTLTVTGTLTSSAGGITATAGDITATAGNVSIANASKGLVIQDGTVSARGTAGQFDLTGGSILLTNANVTANTRILFNRASGNVAVPLVYATNCVGVGVRIIGAETNTFNYLQYEVQ